VACVAEAGCCPGGLTPEIGETAQTWGHRLTDHIEARIVQFTGDGGRGAHAGECG
jgi:hypothetical protein